MTIHREGYSTMILTLIIGSVILIPLWLFIGTGWISLVITALFTITFLFILRFFRYPKRESNPDPNCILAPADGKIVFLEEETETEYFKDSRLKISIFMSGFNVHANWIPVPGVVEYCKYHPGRNLLAIHPKSSDLNERSSIVIQSSNNKEILIRQIAGVFARRVVTYSKYGQNVDYGEELGFIKFGSRLDIFLPPGTKSHVKLGDKVRGNISEIASW